jgi:hypothetical protein
MASNEISVVGNFEWQPPLTLADEIELLDEAKRIERTLWAPGTKDWEAIAGNSTKCSSFKDVIGVILSKPQDSIGRLNIFTHGEGKRISFKGHMVPQTTMVDIFFDDSNTGRDLGILDGTTLDTLNNQGQWFHLNNSPKKYTLADIRKRFVATNPIMVIYACNSGCDPSFLQAVSDTLDVMVDGFLPHVACCPRYRKPQFIDRKHIGIRSCKYYDTTSYYHLLPHAAGTGQAISKKPIKTSRTGIPK